MRQLSTARMASYVVLWFVALVQLYFDSVLTFNLESRLPVIKLGDVPGSYFGYSVAEHQTVDEITNKIDGNWLLVGAPLGKNLQPGTNHSGALYRCPITTNVNDCEQVVTDGKRTVDSKNLMPPGEDEIKDGQWLGVTVRSMGPGKKVMVCAHRYMRKGSDYQWGQGLCYTLSQFLDYDETWEPCKGRPTNRAHEQYGYCQAGTSGLLLDDTAVIGTPGPYTWRGTLFVISVSDNFLNRDKTTYHGPLLEHESPVDKYSYLGMSVTAGQFFGSKIAYAAGAPRANGTGQVVIFTKKRPTENPMDVRLILSGEQFASSFGYELTNADINGDGFPDLVVGAPFFFSREEGGAVYIYTNNKNHCLDCKKPLRLTGKPESRFGFAITNLGDLNSDGYEDIAVGAPYEGNGAIYIYLGSEQGLIPEPSQILYAEDLRTNGVPIKTLGYSLSGGLDLDQNGYPDLMIGAYDVDAVVLLRARPIINILTSVEPSANLQNIDPSRIGCPKHPNANHTCFSFAACVSMKVTTNLTLNYSIEAETFQSGRKFSRVWFGGQEGDKKQSHIVRKRIEMKFDPLRRRGDVKKCETEIVYLKENQRDIQSPIKFQLKYELVQKEPPRLIPGQPLPDIDDYPVLNQQEAAKTFQATFQNDCAGEICVSQLYLETRLLLPSGRHPDTWDLIMGEQEAVRLNVTAYNYGESAYDAWLFVSHPASLNYTAYKTESKHMSCTPHNKTLIKCNIGNPFKQGTPANILLRFDPKGLADTESQLEFVVFANSTSKELDAQAPSVLHINVIRRAEISVTGSVHPDHVYYGGVVRGESAMGYLDDIGERVMHTYHIFNQGPWKVGSLEVHIEWPFQVANNKPQGKWLLYLEDRPTVEGQGGGECFIAQSQVNPLNLTRRPGVEEPPLEALTLPARPLAATVEPLDSTWEPERPHTRRRRRDIEMVVRAESYVDKDGNKHELVNMNCLLGTAKCLKFHCVVFNLRRNHEATIRIRARLWNSTLVEDYPKVYSVNIKSRAKMHLPPGLMILQNPADDEAQVETIAYRDPLDQQEPEPVPVWIIIVAIVAGLLLLVLIILVLWRLGFFKRRRPDPTLSGNLEKHRDENGDYSS
ncbi:integrin alpha-PS1 isoform X2 [Cryptotermes secundus]|uniref:integrin alpha-PS1 isoform X2 n=1 Tax=Cryptotermes secundus TaxID=105785 RepID=UPI000CD7DB7A|nr:integrin alpha-PS1 isoform X2 [Cryptotermes secundus]